MTSILNSVLMAALVVSASSAAMADGFRCEGEGLRVKLYNQVQPSLGTKNPAVLIVSENNAGTLAVVQGDDLVKSLTQDTVIYEGLTHSKHSGRFVSASLEVDKEPHEHGRLAGLHLGLLTLVEDQRVTEVKLVCEHYLKGNL